MRLQASLTTLTGLTALAALSPSAKAQVFSVDWHSSQVSIIDPCTATPVTEGDLLTPAAGLPSLGPLATPCIAITGGVGGLGIIGHAPCVGHTPFTPCRTEVDAVSFGVDYQLTDNTLRYWFSVDEEAIGIASPSTPSVATEGLATGVLEASADLFIDLDLPPGPLPPFAVPPANVGAYDGNGMISASGFKYPGLGLLEPNLPGMPAHPGDNLDAVDIEGLSTGVVAPVYFSMDASFIDPATGFPNSGSALGNGFMGGDILVSTAAAPALWAPAGILGLDFFGPDTDDLDALSIWDNGNGVYDPVQGPYSWLTGGTDQVLFSVRRGSAVIGMPDSIFGIPIEEGDVLIPPVPTGAGGVSPFPGIWVAAENLGLATLRSGFTRSDDLNAIDILCFPVVDCDANGFEDARDIALGIVADCNQNGIPDKCDILSGFSCDANGNAVPDECDWGLPSTYCVAKTSSLGAGCIPFIDHKGTPSVTCPSPFDVTGGNINNFVNGLLFYGFAPAALPFQGGTLCVAPPLRRTPIQNSGGSFAFGNCTGSYTFDFNAWTQSGVDPFLVGGTTVYSQWWFRDTANTFGVGLSNALRFTICP